MRFLRTLSPRRLTAIVVVVAALAATAAVAQAGLIGSDPKPEPKALDRAVLDAVNAPPVKGISARIEFTNSLLPAGTMPGGSPLVSGAEGRLWTTNDGRFRLELQSERGDAQIASDGKTLTVYDATAKKVYRLALPEEKAAREPQERATLAGVRKGLDRLAQAWTLSGAKPTSSAGRASYTVRIAPKDDGGLLGAGKLAWDAANGVPLRAAVYAQGQSDPVLELKATDISFGAVDDADVRVSVPSGVEAVDVDPPAGHDAKGTGTHADVTGVAAVQKRLGFDLSTPAKLAGLPRKEVRLVRFGDENGALSVYGEGLGGLVVLQREAGQGEEPGDSRLPQVNIDGATGTELATALGTFVTFERDGISYTVVGSVPPVAAENAARGLR